jgi:cell division protein FtsL
MIHIQLDGPDKKHYQRKSGAISLFEKLSFVFIGIVVIFIFYILIKV